MEAKFRSASADGQPAVVAGVGAGFGFLMALWRVGALGQYRAGGGRSSFGCELTGAGGPRSLAAFGRARSISDV